MSSPYGGGEQGGDPPGWSWPPAYGPQQFGPANPAGQPPAGFPAAGGAPPGGHHQRPRKVALVVGAGAAIVVVVVAVVVAVIMRGGNHSASTASSSAAAAPTTRNAQSATDCTHSVSSGQLPVNGMVSAGGLSFPQSVAPDWRAKPEHRVPNSIDAVSLDETVSETASMSWIAQVTVGVTNFDQSLSLADQAKLMLKCIVVSELYDGASATAAGVSAKSGRLDGISTSEIDVAVPVTFEDPTIKGDDLVIIVVGTSPSTYFLGSSPFGDQARRDVVQAAVKSLHVAAD
ncbi:hypothetical protein [Mycobacterium talmoniae]|uniref:hypothetical protein n=1 Tax=Mycobacterium talmoniae TaxID=1858794 RepID=UPI000A9DD52A|nr:MULTISPECIES: hypothetical protein [Mycobacterium]TDH53135.1 hypothetical protein E2F47_13320 [Mycobacterium eburneum]